VSGLDKKAKMTNKELVQQTKDEMISCVIAQVNRGTMTKKTAKKIIRNPIGCMSGDVWKCHKCGEHREYKDSKASRLAWRLHTKMCKG
jgi:hypothetical protein